MVEGMKALAIEFTLTRATVLKMIDLPADAPALEEGRETIRFRVITSSKGTTAEYLDRNDLGESTWRRVTRDRTPENPCIGSALRWMSFHHDAVITLALGHIAEALDPLRVEVRELPSGAIVFDLGTV